jgi:hypothetical protein
VTSLRGAQQAGASGAEADGAGAAVLVAGGSDDARAKGGAEAGRAGAAVPHFRAEMRGLLEGRVDVEPPFFFGSPLKWSFRP